MFAPWNEICAVSGPHRGMLNIPSEGSLAQQDGTIPLGPAPWNLHSACPIDINGRIEIEFFNLLKPGEAIPLGFTPWNEVCTVKFPKWGKFSFPSEKGTFQGYQAIPLGIYIFSKGLLEAPSTHREGGAFLLYLSRGT